MTIKPNEQRSSEARRQAVDALGHHIQQRSVAIVGLKDGEPSFNGSGTCIQVARRFFIATAGHLIRGRGSARLALVSSLHPRHSQLPVNRFGYRGGDVGDIDVGWIELSPEEAAQTGRVFITVDRLHPFCRHLENELTQTFGVPTELTTKTLDGKLLHLGFQPIWHVSTTLPPESWPCDGDPDVDIYLTYSKDGHTRTSGEPIDRVDPGGMSGGGIWIDPHPNSGIWSPDNARLIGVEKSWRAEKEYMRGTQIQHWMNMIAEEFPELRPVLWPSQE